MRLRKHTIRHHCPSHICAPVRAKLLATNPAAQPSLRPVLLGQATLTEANKHVLSMMSGAFASVQAVEQNLMVKGFNMSSSAP